MPVDACRRFDLYAAFEPSLGEATAVFMEYPIAWAESWPIVDAAAERERVAGASEGGDHDAR